MYDPVSYETSPLARREPQLVEALADLDTPPSTYLKVGDAPYSCLLESV